MGTRDRLGTAAYEEFAVDVAGMFLDGVYADHQFASDLRVGIASADQPHDEYARARRRSPDVAYICFHRLFRRTRV